MLVIKQDSLVVYKNHPARVLRMGDRLEIELVGGEIVRVRPKDVFLLHPGPLSSLTELRPVQGDLQTAWEILAGEKTTLAELAELAYGDFTPASAWATWQQVSEQLLFSGQPEEIRVSTAVEVEQKQRERAQAAAEKQAWKSFLERTRQGDYDPSDHEFLIEVESLALGRSGRSQVLREIGRPETPESAHALLLELGVWDAQVNPYPQRLGTTLAQVELSVPALAEEERLDLTQLTTYAIDDEGTDTPDDAISLEGDRLWVHVADVAAVVQSGSELDLEARARGMSLHLPEGTIHLLPRELIRHLGLGLQEISPALSFYFDFAPEGTVHGFGMAPSWVRVQRLTYDQAESMVDEEPLYSIYQRMIALRERRRANQAVLIDFPEVRLQVKQEQVDIQRILPLRSRMLVEEAMILCGGETARFAIDRGICVPFSQQEALETDERPETPSGMYALRRLLRRSRFRSSPAPHSGLGLPAYTQATSPLRRYLDLFTHQQLRAVLRGVPALDESQVSARIAAVEEINSSVRQAEVLSERHWTMVYLLQHPGWRGEGILVEKRGSLGTLILPDLALEPRVHLKQNYPLDQAIPLMLTGVNLPLLEASFRVL